MFNNRPIRIVLASLIPSTVLPVFVPITMAGTPIFEIVQTVPLEFSMGVGVESVFANGSPRVLLEVSFSGVGKQDSDIRYFSVQAQA